AALFYQGGVWPKRYHDKLLMCNIHGNRLNMDNIVRKGSGYAAKRDDDFLMANDPWFRGLVLTATPDGNMYVADWHDTGECHNYDKTHPSGRIYKIEYGKTKFVEVDLSKKTDKELVELQGSDNEWYVRQSRRLLQERAALKKLSPGLLEEPPAWVKPTETQAQLRWLWLSEAV